MMRGSIEEVCMSNVLIRQGDWVVVCDGKKALVLENVGDTKLLNLKTREVHEQPDQKTHEQGTDAPGRSINSIDSRRSAMEQTLRNVLRAEIDKDFVKMPLGEIEKHLAA
jgi:protein required for attachment to host cells